MTITSSFMSTARAPAVSIAVSLVSSVVLMVRLLWDWSLHHIARRRANPLDDGVGHTKVSGNTIVQSTWATCVWCHSLRIEERIRQ
jgi:hypothetical protein